MKSKFYPYFALIIVGLTFGLLAPHFLSQYGMHIAIISLFYVLMASAWNLVAGFTGQISFAQAAFASLGAYGSGLLSIHTSVPMPIAILGGGLIASILGCFLGRLCLPLGGKYLSLVTLSFSEILRIILTNEDRWTRGTQGLQVRGLFDVYSKASSLWVFIILAILVLSGIRILLKSSKGLQFRAVRSDEIAAASLAVPVTQVRILAFTISSFISGLAGAVYGHYLNIITPDLGSLDQMFLILAMTIVGGKATWLGPVVGAIFLEVLSEQVRGYGTYDILIFGLVTLLMVRFAPEGLTGGFLRIMKGRRKHVAPS